MKNKKLLGMVLVTACLTLIVLIGTGMLTQVQNTKPEESAVAIKFVASQIAASGSIHSRAEATLHFQTAGKLVYLPFKQGDSVSVGQTIAELDTYALQKQLQIAANTYEMAKNTNDQVQENQQAGILEGQQRVTFDTTSHNGYNTLTEAQVITDTVERLVGNSLLTQNTAQLNVDLANYALQLAQLTAPFSGVITTEDVTTPNVNVTPTTNFSLADPSEKVFRANVDADSIDFVTVGASAQVLLDGQTTPFQGTVLTIYPQKQTLATGEQVYQVDIQAPGLTAAAFGQNGSVLIVNNNQTKSLMVPTWAIVGHDSLWVWNGQKAILKTITLGATHGTMTEVTSGLSAHDSVIISPESIAKTQYQML